MTQAGSNSTIRNEFRDFEYRHAYADDFLDSSIAIQLRKLREQNGLNQEQLAEKIGTRQGVVSKNEDVNYGSWSINTLRKYARAFDVALVVKFESFGDRLRDIETFSVDALRVPPFSDDAHVQPPRATALPFGAVRREESGRLVSTLRTKINPRIGGRDNLVTGVTHAAKDDEANEEAIRKVAFG